MSEPTGAHLRGALDLSALANRGAPGDQAPASGASTSVPSLVLDGTDVNFTEFLELSKTVPVIVDLWAEWCEPCKQLTPALQKLVMEYDGRLLLVKVDVDANPQLTQAFQAQSIPAVVGVVAGRPVPLFTGAIAEQQIRDVFEQVLALAEQNGAAGRVTVAAADAEPSEEPEPVEEPLPPHHAEAYEAIERGDYDTAVAEYKTAIAQNPGDRLAVAGLAQVGLLARLKAKTADEIRSAAADAPRDVAAQLDVADLDISGGHVEDAFDRLLALFPTLDAEGKNQIRERMIELFEIVGVDDPRVTKARSRLTTLLY